LGFSGQAASASDPCFALEGERILQDLQAARQELDEAQAAVGDEPPEDDDDDDKKDEDKDKEPDENDEGEDGV
jgi:hypothetical protein